MTTGPGGVTFRNVSFTPPDRRSTSPEAATSPILNDVSLQLASGTTTAFLGRSGSGKTTLLRTVNGLVLPGTGSVEVNGKTVDARTSPQDLRRIRHSIGYVIQETGLFPHMTIVRNVGLPMELEGTGRAQIFARAGEMLERVGLEPGRFGSRYPHELSGGQRQRAGLARALVNDPAVLLLDEPFGALDPLTRADMQAMLRALLEKTALVVTHDLQEALLLAERVIFIDGGRVVADLHSSDVLQSELPVVQEYVRTANRFFGAA